MPEGNEIHRWAERHAAAFAGKVVRVDGPQGRFVDSDVIDGRKLVQVMAVGKHLGYDFGRDRILHVHLGLQGDFTEGSGPLPPVKGALRLRMWNEAAVKRPAVEGESKPHRWYSEDDGTGNIAPEQVAWVELRGPMDCAVYSQAKWEKLLERLGPDPLNGDGPEKAMEKIGEEQETDWRAVDGPVGGGGDWEYLSGGVAVSGAAESFYAGEGCGGEEAEGDMEGCGGVDAGGDGGPADCDDAAKDRPHKNGWPALKEEAHYVYRRHGQPVFCVRHEGDDEGDGREEPLLVSGMSGGV